MNWTVLYDTRFSHQAILVSNQDEIMNTILLLSPMDDQENMI